MLRVRGYHPDQVEVGVLIFDFCRARKSKLINFDPRKSNQTWSARLTIRDRLAWNFDQVLTSVNFTEAASQNSWGVLFRARPSFHSKPRSKSRGAIEMETIELSEMLASVQVSETDAKLSFLPVRCWQNAMATARTPRSCRSVSKKSLMCSIYYLERNTRRVTASL